MDIESPYHPGRLANFSERETELDDLELLNAPPHSFEEVIQGFKWRIELARESFPKATLGLYGVFIATGQAKYTESLEAHIAKLEEAISMGLFDDLDLLVPVIYPRFGPDDSSYDQQQAIDYTSVTLEMTADAQSEMTSPLPMAPALAFKVFNGNSVHTNTPATPEYLQWQIEALQSLNHSGTVLFWAGKEDTIPGGIQSTLEAIAPAISNCMCE